MKTVFLFVSNYVWSSDFLRTEYIKYLSSKYRVVVFIPSAALEGGRAPYYQAETITYIPWDIERPAFWNLFGKLLRYSLIRKYDFEPVVVRNRENGMKDMKRKVLRALSYLAPSSFWTPDRFTGWELALYPKSHAFAEHVRTYQPSLILTATPGFSHYDAEAITMAKQMHLPTVAINFSWDNLHNGGIHFRRTDYLITWNETIKHTAVSEYGYAPERVFVSGVMRFDGYAAPLVVSREQFLESKGLDPKEKTILITTVTKGNYPDEHLLLGQLLEAREQGRFAGYPNFFVRMHPKEEFDKFAAYLENGQKGLHVEYPGTLLKEGIGATIELSEADLENLKLTLAYSDVEVNYLSTITLEAFIFDTPVVNINYPEKYHRGYTFRHYKPIIDMKAVRLAYSFDELVALINGYLEDRNLDRTERTLAKDTLVGAVDGNAHKRNVDALDAIISA